MFIRNNKKGKKIYLAYLTVATFILSGILAMSPVINTANAQAATSYTWKDRQTIGVSGGNVKANQTIRVDANDAAPSKGGGRILTSEDIQRQVCGGLFGWFCNEETVSNDCYISIGLTFSSPSSAVVSSKKSTIPGSGTPNGPVDCTQDSSYSAYNGKTISIGGTRPGDAGSTTETTDQKLVQFQYKSALGNQAAPGSVTLTIEPSNKSITAPKYEVGGNVSYTASTQLDPGSYKVCVNGAECKTFTKEKFKALSISLGAAEGFGSKQIQIQVQIEQLGGAGVTNAGPLPIYLYDSAQKEIKKVDTNKVAIENSAQTDSRTYYLRATMDDINAGSYKICVGSGDAICQNITKEQGSTKKVDFKVTGQQAIDIVKLGSGSDEKTSCAIEGIGWIVCPVAGFLGMLTDGLFGVLTTLLSFTPVQSNGATYDTWQAMRNIANAAFVIAFLIIIFSQLTGAGINNYGIKKMIPRLIVAAILVNVSYFICQAAVDLSNITGYSLQSLMTRAAATASGGSNNLDVWGDLVAWIIAGAGTSLAVGGLTLTVLGAGGWIPALALLLPVLVTVLFAVLTVVLVLAARQAIIIILIVISPLAFVAYLLPNTEDWFHKWRKLFITLLLMFPIISVIFGGSQLAAAVIRAGTNNPLIYILSLAVQVIPFFLVPIIMKTAGGLLNRFGGIINNPNKGPFDSLRKRAEAYAGYRSNDANARNLKYDGKKPSMFVRSARRKTERDSIYSSAESRAREAGVEYVGNQLNPGGDGNPANGKFAIKMAGTTDIEAITQASARGASAVDEIEAKELKAGHVLLTNAQVDGNGLKGILSGKEGDTVMGMNGTAVKVTAATRKAAASMMMSQGREMDSAIMTLATSGDEKMQKLAVTLMQQNYATAKGKQVGLTDEKLMAQIAGGELKTEDDFKVALQRSAAKKAVDLSVDNMAGQEKSSLVAIKDGLTTLAPENIEKINQTSLKVTTTPSARAKTNDDTYRVIAEFASRATT
ncbi:hypothetical protein D3C73_102100 [compost metagenome]